MHHVFRAGLIVLLADIGVATLAAVSLISKFSYERLPPDRVDDFVRSGYRFYGCRWRLFAKLTVAGLVVGGVLVLVGLL